MTSSSSYERIPYESTPIPETAPEEIAIASWMHGGPVPPVGAYRFLELGCGDGANLVGLAFHRPEARFLGVDAGTIHIERGRARVQALGLTNLSLEQGDIADLDARLDGAFDYIVAHGVFSWVSDEIRTAILELCRRRLAPEGLAYISYNTHPGWHVRGIVRDLLLRSEHVKGPLEEQAEEARTLIRSLRAALPAEKNSYTVLFEHELSRVIDFPDPYVMHEYFEAYNRAFWFRDFVRLARRAGLRHVADMQFNRREGRIPEAIRRTLEAGGVRGEEQEESIDALFYRQFRMAILARKDATGPPPMTARDVERLAVASELMPKADEVELRDGHPERFTEPEGETIEESAAAVKTALILLRIRWPRSYGFPELVEAVRKALAGKTLDPGTPETVGRSLAEAMFRLGRLGTVRLRFEEGAEAPSPGDRPDTSVLAGEEADRPYLTTPWYTMFPLEGIDG